MPASEALLKLYEARRSVELAIRALEEQEAAAVPQGECPHPSSKVINLGTLANPNHRLCGACSKTFELGGT